VLGTWDDESAEVAAMHHAVSARATYSGLDLGLLGLLFLLGVVGLAVGLVAVGLPSRCGRARRDYRKGAQRLGVAPPESPEGEVADSQAAELTARMDLRMEPPRRNTSPP
jgi:hypothetical protein